MTTVLVSPTDDTLSVHKISLFLGNHIGWIVQCLENRNLIEPCKPFYCFTMSKAIINNGYAGYHLNLSDYSGPPNLQDSIMKMVVATAVANFITRHPDSDIQHLIFTGATHLIGSVLNFLELRLNNNGFVSGNFQLLAPSFANPWVSTMALVSEN